MGVVMKQFIKRLIADESGISALEFGLVIAILSISIIANLHSLRDALNGFYGSAASNMTN